MNTITAGFRRRVLILAVGSSLLSTALVATSVSVAHAEDAPAAEESSPSEESSPEPEPSPEPTVEPAPEPEPSPEPDPEPEPSPEPSPEPAPSPAPSYTPPPEASEGVGGWAVVDPNTGRVHGVIVGTIDTYNSRGGAIGQSYMGCSADCVLRFQTRATSDGNVAGWHGPGVSYNSNDQTFSIGSRNGSTTTTQKLVPERTARDAAGMDLSTGFVDRVDTLATDEVRSRVNQGFLESSNDSVSVDYLVWGEEGQSFRYTNLQTALATHESDVEQALLEAFPAPEVSSSDDPLAIPSSPSDEAPEETPAPEEEVVESGVDEENPVVQTIRRLAESVMEFFRGIAGMSGTGS